MLIERKIQGVVLSFDCCVELDTDYYQYDESQHMELYSDFNRYLERYECSKYEPLYIYHNLLVKYRFNKTEQTMLFPKVYLSIRVERMQTIVMSFNVITRKYRVIG